ncbi:hypothetical protein [Flavihumibacter solisilvae]|uniref:Uncharacterized protein n=1 Tax=Flavihumibacter solisilvae TaxID=1349421 RepID=A0A0C1L3S9_9BACT|nr:hypothetical protein [Flavihumibacter solisilvae]KIC94692.1 hypothetical protein OI18_09370 [Flavihumibacter solisilvae]
MPQSISHAEICYLNRLALYTREDPLKADPQEIYAYFFDLEQPAEICNRLLHYCTTAAGSGSPVEGKLASSRAVGFFQKLELLTEISYLVYAGVISIKPANEPRQPLAVLKDCFQYKSLGEWKELAESWCDCCLTGQSITDFIDAQDILLSVFNWWKLIDVSWELFSSAENNRAEEPEAYYYTKAHQREMLVA